MIRAMGRNPENARAKDASPMVTASLLNGLSQAENEHELNSKLFRLMCLVRHLELSLLKLFGEGKLSGTTHTCIGQEAIAGALSVSLRTGDVVFSSHRCHGHFIACGGSVTQLIAEIMGRKSDICLGRGGSQHLQDTNFYSNGVQGGVVGNATGMALAEKLKGGKNVTIAILGDGTLGEGLVYESFNFASLRALPILYLLEDNRYSQSTPSYLGVSGSMTARAAAFAIEAAEIESNDVLEIADVLRTLVERVRAQQRPILLVVHTYRLSPHSKGDDTRDPGEIERWRKQDPLLLLGSKLPGELTERLEAEARNAIELAIGEAEKIAFPEASESGPLCTVPVGEYPTPWAQANVTYIQSINAGLLKAMERDSSCFFIGEDILDPYGGAFKASRGCSTQYPERSITTPVSEAGIVAWATGAALRGMRPIAEIMFGDFLSLAADQILNHASKYRWMYGEKVSVPLVIRTPMGGRRGYGPTHSQSIEAIFTSVSGLNIVAPSHLLDVGELLFRCASLVKDPTLFIENKSLYGQRLLVAEQARIRQFFACGTSSCFPTLHLSLANFEKPDVALVTYGGSVPNAMEAAQRLLMEEECLCDIVIPSLIAPLPTEEIATFLGRAHRIVVLEEGGSRAGWGAEVIAALAERESIERKRYLRIGAPDSPLPSSKKLETELLPDANLVVQRVKTWLKLGA
jgi:2-oxoisovalerate dehydrogenase E1 component